MPQVPHVAQPEQVLAVQETAGKDSKEKSPDSKNIKGSVDKKNAKGSEDSKNAKGSAGSNYSKEC